MVKADAKNEHDPEITNFEYLTAKTTVLQKEIQKIQEILKANGIHKNIEDYAETDIENAVWEELANSD